MVRISEGECQQQWGKLRDMIMSEPVTITSNGHDQMVVMTAEEYNRLKRRDRRVMGLADFTEEDLRLLREMDAPPEAAAFDHEMKD